MEMNRIYMVGGVPYVGDLLPGFATDEEGIRRIVCNYWRKAMWSPKGVEITVDMEHMQCKVKDAKRLIEGHKYSFYIHAIERITDA